MEAAIKTKIIEIFIRNNFSKEDACFLADVFEEIDEKGNRKFRIGSGSFEENKSRSEVKLFDTQKGVLGKITNVERTIYIIAILQYIGIVAALLIIFNFMLK